MRYDNAGIQVKVKRLADRTWKATAYRRERPIEQSHGKSMKGAVDALTHRLIRYSWYWHAASEHNTSSATFFDDLSELAAKRDDGDGHD